jgi:hypothetical protein
MSLKDQIVQLIGQYQLAGAALAHTEGGLQSEVYTSVVRDLRAAIGMEKHQVVTWLDGAEPPHYEIRGTGLVYDGPPARDRT